MIKGSLSEATTTDGFNLHCYLSLLIIVVNNIFVKKVIKYGALFFLATFLTATTITLGIGFLKRYREKILETGHVTPISKDNVVFSTDSGNMRYFWEPRPNNVEKHNPEWLGYEIIYTINSDSLNERHEYSIAKDKKTFRILTIGDSFTFGDYVNTPENYSETLEDSLNEQLICNDINNFEVINLGVGGYDLEYMVGRLLQRGLKYEPDLVFLLVNEWNLVKINEYCVPVQEEFESKGVPIFDPKTGKYPSATLAHQKFLEDYSLEQALEYHRRKLDILGEHYKDKLVVVTFPSNPEDIKEFLKKFTRTNSNYSYFEEVVDLKSNYLYKLPDFHPNTEGHKRLAQDLLDYLLKSTLSNCHLSNLILEKTD